MKTTSIGHHAESAAAKHLVSLGYNILDQNWRTRYCEIDIVAEKDKCIHFVEVKYRSSANWGGGLDYITAKKQKQMGLAAEMWVSAHNWLDEYCLGAVEVSGADFAITNVILNL